MSTTACQVRRLARPCIAYDRPATFVNMNMLDTAPRRFWRRLRSPVSSIANRPAWVNGETYRFGSFGKLPCCRFDKSAAKPLVRAFHVSFSHHPRLAEGIAPKLAHLPDTVNCRAVERKDCRPYSPHRLWRGPRRLGGNGVR